MKKWGQNLCHLHTCEEMGSEYPNLDKDVKNGVKIPWPWYRGEEIGSKFPDLDTEVKKFIEVLAIIWKRQLLTSSLPK